MFPCSAATPNAATARQCYSGDHCHTAVPWLQWAQLGLSPQNTFKRTVCHTRHTNRQGAFGTWEQPLAPGGKKGQCMVMLQELQLECCYGEIDPVRRKYKCMAQPDPSGHPIPSAQIKAPSIKAECQPHLLPCPCLPCPQLDVARNQFVATCGDVQHQPQHSGEKGTARDEGTLVCNKGGGSARRWRCQDSCVARGNTGVAHGDIGVASHQRIHGNMGTSVVSTTPSTMEDRLVVRGWYPLVPPLQKCPQHR